MEATGCVEVVEAMETEKIVIGIIVAVGTPVALLPQMIKLLWTKTSKGLSYYTFFVGATAQFSTMLNALIFKWKQFEDCGINGFAHCQYSLLDFYQLALQWTFYTPLYFMYLYYYGPRDTPKRKRDFQRASILLCIHLLFAVSVFFPAMFLNLAKPCTNQLFAFANGLGVLAAACFIVMYLPQIYTTYRTKGPGAVSILTYLISSTGNLIVTYFQIFAAHDKIATWLPSTFITLEIYIILAMCLFYWVRDRRKRKAGRSATTAGGDEEESRRLLDDAAAAAAAAVNVVNVDE